MRRLEKLIASRIADARVRAELNDVIRDRERRIEWQVQTAEMTVQAQRQVDAYSAGVTSANVQVTHCRMAQAICSAFGIQRGRTDWEALFSRSSRGGQANYRNRKPWWDKGDNFARCETVKFGTSIIAACWRTRGTAESHPRQTIEAVIDNFLE
jgi:hypothetical protein